MLRRISLTFTAVIVAVGLLSACTPDQLKTYQELTGDRLSLERQESLLALDDHPFKLNDGSVIQLDGSVAPPTPCDVQKTRVNSMVYVFNEPAPAMDTFKSVASCRGWTDEQINSWLIAVQDIMAGESGFCPNVIGGAVNLEPVGCIMKQGRKGDAGFGQLIGIHYRHTTPGSGWLCGQEGLCSKWDIIATPWNSMTAFLALIERSGTSGYCYNAQARRYHRTTCNNPGIDV